MLKESLWVALGGAAGSVLRFWLSSALAASAIMLPLGTFAVNMIGSFVIGIMLASIGGGSWHHLCIIGFCGGFTTFSTFSAEVFAMMRVGDYSHAALYIVLSVVLCVIATAVGFYIGARLK